MFPIKPGVIVQKLRDGFKILDVHRAFGTAGDHEHEGIDHTGRADDQEQVHAGEEHPNLPMLASDV